VLKLFLRYFCIISSTILAPSAFAQDQLSVPWEVICTFENKIAESAADRCRMAQSIITAESNKPILVIRAFQDPQPLLLATVPLNVFLKPGLTVTIDNNRPNSFSFEICNQEGCHIGIPMDVDFINALKRGLFARFTFRDAQGLDITLPVDLSGFTKSWEALSSANQ
jgi:invasion protein IalB